MAIMPLHLTTRGVLMLFFYSLAAYFAVYFLLISIKFTSLGARVREDASNNHLSNLGVLVAILGFFYLITSVMVVATGIYYVVAYLLS